VICASSASASSHCPPLTNRGRTFEFTVEFFPSKAKLGDGSVRDIERDTIVKWEVECAEIDSGVDQDVEEGCDGAARVVCVDWNSVQLEDTTDLVIALMADTEMAKFFGIPIDPVDDQDEEERDESSLPNDANIDACEDVDGQLMKDVADDVDDAHDDELVSVYDK